jgi:tetratricopeptide (TPR) repeat protein
LAGIYHSYYQYLRRIGDPRSLIAIKKADFYYEGECTADVLETLALFGSTDDVLKMYEDRPDLYSGDARCMSTIFHQLLSKAREAEASEAESLIERALKMNVFTIEATLDLCAYYKEKKKYSDIRRTLVRHLDNVPGDPEICLKLGYLEYINKNYLAALETFRLMNKGNDMIDLKARYGMAISYEGTKKFQRAKVIIQEISSNPLFHEDEFEEFIDNFPCIALNELLYGNRSSNREECERIKYLIRVPDVMDFKRPTKREYWSGWER